MNFREKKSVFPCSYQHVLLFSIHQNSADSLMQEPLGHLAANPVQYLLMRWDGVLGTTGVSGLAP